MKFLSTVCTDAGIQKETNQDSALIKVAETSKGNICFAAICDGMGGLAKGELASATIIRALDEWFDNELSFHLADPNFDNIKNRMWTLIAEQNNKISSYAKQHHLSMGTTLSAFLIINSKYLIIHVGDSRVYKLEDQLEILTKDQTVVARDLECGLITPEQALNDPRKNVLLQCIGASSFVVPEIIEGTVSQNQVYMLCSDGFRHKISNEEIFEAFNPQAIDSENTMTEKSTELIELCKQRKETDNITVALVKAL